MVEARRIKFLSNTIHFNNFISYNIITQHTRKEVQRSKSHVMPTNIPIIIYVHTFVPLRPERRCCLIDTRVSDRIKI